MSNGDVTVKGRIVLRAGLAFLTRGGRGSGGSIRGGGCQGTQETAARHDCAVCRRRERVQGLDADATAAVQEVTVISFLLVGLLISYAYAYSCRVIQPIDR